MKDAAYWVRALQLKKHPEGGYYRETYRCAETAPAQALPPRFDGPRAFSTAILYLLRGGEFSAFHRLRSDEVWHFYDGHPLTLHVIDPQGQLVTLRLGDNPSRGTSLQAVVAAGCWFAAELEARRGFALVGCTVAPGFDFADFELAGREALAGLYPQHRALIARLTR
jgi:uncharacterized protein